MSPERYEAGTHLLFHDLRRNASRNMMEARIDQSRRMKIMGHKTNEMDKRYAIVDDLDVVQAGRELQAHYYSKQPKATSK